MSELLVGRHEESEANRAHALASDGDLCLLHAIRHIPDRDFTLSADGIRRAAHVGSWLKKSGLLPFDVYVFSEFRRAQQTAHLLEIRGAQWLAHRALNERQWGDDGKLSTAEREAIRPGWKQEKEATPYDWRPLGGETLRERMEVFAAFLRTCNARYAGKRAFFKCHGETALAIQAVVEGLSQAEFAQREKELRLKNGCMVHYRREPEGRVMKRFIDPHHDHCTSWVPIAHR